MIQLGRLITALIILVVAETKLYQVVSLFRHGARYHLNAYYDGNATKERWGELTAVGMRQHETLGKLLRRDYITNQQFLSNTYKQEEMVVYSTDVNRTLESALSQLYGLYPLGAGPVLGNESKQYHIPPYNNKTDSAEQSFALPGGHQPIPVYIDSSIIMLDCPNFDYQMNKNINYQSDTYKEMNLTYFPFLKRMSTLFNISLSTMNFSKASSLYDTLTVDKYLGRPMPQKDFNDDDYLNLRHLHYWYNYFKISYNLSRALNTNKFERVLSDFDSRISNLKTKTLKWTFLSAHDTDVSAALLDLNISSSQCVQDLYRKGSTTALICDPAQQYATNIIFELHSDNDIDFYVKIRHDGKYLYLCEKKSYTCPYAEWKSRIQDSLVNVQQVCNSVHGNKNDALNARFESTLTDI